MNKIFFLIAGTVVWTYFCFAQSQPVLQRWVEVMGTVQNEELGTYVTGITPSANLPYRAAVSKVGSTAIYRLQSPADTIAQYKFIGENLLTGDLNGDGYQDIVIAKYVNFDDTVFIYWGTSTGIDTVNPLKIPGENHGDWLWPICIGDINNDGKSDLILGAPYFPIHGKIYIFINPVITSIPDATITGDSVNDGLGTTCCVADLNDNGFNDLVLRGHKQSGPMDTWFDYVNVYWDVGKDTLNLKLGLQMRVNKYFRRGLACFDVNGDGKSDLLWAAYDSLYNYVYIHFGRSHFDTIPDLRLVNPGVADFGDVIVNAGDMNGDGYSDIAVGCPYADYTSGYVFIYAGGPKIDKFFDAGIGKNTYGGFGFSVASVGDINGDGLSDIIVGAPADPWAQCKGYWGIFLGSSAIKVGVFDVAEEIPEHFSLYQNYPNPFNSRTIISYVLNIPGNVTIKVYNILGIELKTLINEQQEVGEHTIEFDGDGFSSGIYFYRLNFIGNGVSNSQTRAMTIMK